MSLAGEPTRALQAGERTFLRRPELYDEREFLARTRASRALHGHLVQPPLTRTQFARFLIRSEQPGQELHLLCRREDGAVCGVLNLSDIVRGALQVASLGYYALVPFAGQGYMTEGVQLVLRQAFRRLGLHRVEASIQPTNTASLALIRRSGFREEGFSPRYVRIAGRWRDHLRFALHADEWRACQRRQAQPRRRRP
jgi:ribosomal-protein-alanine N-acetyltransferase